jgi:hypothetical protein
MKIISISLVILVFGFSQTSSKMALTKGFSDTTIIVDKGHVKIITHYKGDKKNGKEIYLRDNGDTAQIIEYKDGLYDGKYTAFLEDNKIGTLKYYRQDTIIGESLSFDTVGFITARLIPDQPYHRNSDVWSGKAIFYKKDQPIVTQFWQNGKRSSIIVHDSALYKALEANNYSLGHKLYNETCAACHAIDHELLAPQLANAVNSRTQNWLINFIRNGDSLYKAKDKIAVQLYEKYKPTHHPDYTYLTKKDVEEIIKYVKDKQ